MIKQNGPGILQPRELPFALEGTRKDVANEKAIDWGFTVFAQISSTIAARQPPVPDGPRYLSAFDDYKDDEGIVMALSRRAWSLKSPLLSPRPHRPSHKAGRAPQNLSARPFVPFLFPQRPRADPPIQLVREEDILK